MIARIHLPRRRGVLLAQGPSTAAWSDEGYVEFLVDRAGPQPGLRLVLRALQSAPGCGVMGQLYGPTLASVEHEVICLWGVEPIDTADGLAAVQEWLVRPRG